MIAISLLLLRMLCDYFKPRPRLEAEILILRHQLNVLQQRTPRRRLHLRWVDRSLFIWLYRRYPRILDALSIFRPETVVRWHRKGLAHYWRWKSRSPGGRPRIAKEVRELIRRMSFENSLWGATKIHGELLKLGIAVAQSTVSVYLRRPARGCLDFRSPLITSNADIGTLQTGSPKPVSTLAEYASASRCFSDITAFFV
jgi:hypothetical protein